MLSTVAEVHTSATPSSLHSQPSEKTWFWSWYVAVHWETTQLPVEHPTVLVWGGVGLVQLFPQDPQLRTSPAMLVSQPSVCLLPLQSDQPAWQAPLQTPPAQLGVTWLPEQGVLHVPQWEVLLAVLISQPSVSLLPLQSA